MTLNLCIITSSYAFCRDDGAASAGVFVRDFAAAVAEQGHQVTVLTQRTSAADAEPETSVPGQSDSQPGVNVRTFDWSGGRRPLASLRLSRLRDAWLMLRLLRNGGRALAALHAEQNFDHLLAMWAVPAGVWARQLQRSGGVPYTVWCLGSDIWTYGRLPLLRQWVRGVLRSADHRYADGSKLADLASRLAGMPVDVLHSCRRLDRAETRRISLDGTGPRFLFVGRYERVKGGDVLLEAMSRYVARQRRGFLYLFGGGSMAGELAQRAAADDLRDHHDRYGDCRGGHGAGSGIHEGDHP